MPFRKSPSMDVTGIARVAQGWGKVGDEETGTTRKRGRS